MVEDRTQKPAVEKIAYSISLPANGVALYSWKLDAETSRRMPRGKRSHRSNIPDLKRLSSQFTESVDRTEGA
jgi:predicted secreted protein